MRLFRGLAAAAAVTVLLLPSLAAAQKAAVPPLYSDSQISRARAVMAHVDAAVDAALDPRLKASMQADLKSIVAIKDEKGRAAAIVAYKGKYAPHYKKALAAGKIDMNTVAAELSQILGHRFVTRDGIAVVYAAVIGSNSTEPPAEPVTHRLAERDWTLSANDSSNCFLGSSRGTTWQSKTLTLTGGAAVAGECTGGSGVVYEEAVPAGKKIDQELTADLHCHAFAVAVAGATSSYTTASINIDGRTGGNKKVECEAFAPIAWADEVSQDSSDARVTGTLREGTARMQGGTYLTVIAGGGSEGDGVASVGSMDGKVTLRSQ